MKGEDKKLEIISVAEKLFSKNGFEATSTRDIASAANMNIAMISYYFGSKEHLLEEIIQSRLSDLKINESDFLREGLEPEAQISNYISQLISKFNHNSDFYNVLHSELTIKRRVFGGKKYNDIKNHNDDILNKIVELGKQQGIFSPNANANILQVFIIGPYVNFILNKKYYMELLKIETDESWFNYVNTTFKEQLVQFILNFLKAN